MAKQKIEVGSTAAASEYKVVVTETGPYHIYGSPPLATQHIIENEVGESWREQVEARYGERFTRIDPLSLNICCHTGPGALGVGCAVYED